MSDFYARYKAGEWEAVWRELVNLGATANVPPVRAEAVGVASELVERCYAILRQLMNRLGNLGYAFENPDDVLVEANSGDLPTLEALEAKMGVLPIVARKWYERIRSADFSQQEAQMFTTGSFSGSPVSGLGMNTPLVFLSIPKCLTLKERIATEEAAAGGDVTNLDHFLPLGAWGSNCMPKGFWLPQDSFDAGFYNEGWGPVFFVGELRNAFQWGGFPRWQNLMTKKKQAHPLRNVPAFETILPILKDGLTPI
jgi:hypothetical protein